MNFFCTDRVKTDIEKLEKKPSYSNLRLLFYEYLVSHSKPQDWKSGSRLCLDNENFHFIKRYFGGSGAYRLCYVLAIRNGEVTIAGVYPKTGSQGSSNLTDEGKVMILNEAHDGIRNNSRFKIKLDSEKKSISFELEEKKENEILLISQIEKKKSKSKRKKKK